MYKREKEGLVFSTVSGTVIWLQGQELECIERLKEKEFSAEEMPIDVFREFVEHGVVVPADYDEVQNVIARHKQAIQEQDVLHLTIFITDQCNFNCSYCFVNKEKNNVMQETVFDKLMHFIENRIDNYKGLDISWFGGEPLEQVELLVQYTSRMKELCLQREKTFQAFMVTNGYDLTLPNITKLYEAGVHGFQVTFDGDEITHDSIRSHNDGSSTFNRIFHNLRSIKLTKYRDIYICVRCNMNTESVEQFIEKYMKHLGNDSRFSLVLKPIVNYDSDSESELLSIYAGKIKELCRIAKKYNVVDDFVKSKFDAKDAWCPTLSKNSHVISPDGKLYTCDSTVNNPKYCIGSIDSSGEILLNEEFDDTYMEHEIEGRCLECKKMPMCYGSCQRIYHKLKKHACAYSDDDIVNYLKYMMD